MGHRPTLVIFDLDGTLIDSAPGIVAHLERAFRTVVPDLPLPPLRPFIGPPVARMIPAIAPTLGAEVHAEVVAAFRSSYDAAGWQETRLLPGVHESLARLRAAEIRCALATYKPWAPTARILAHLRLDTAFGEVRCVDGPAARFDDKRDMLLSIMQAVGVTAAEVVYVGDTPSDVDAAARAGLEFVGVASEPDAFAAGVVSHRSLMEVATGILGGGV